MLTQDLGGDLRDLWTMVDTILGPQAIPELLDVRSSTAAREAVEKLEWVSQSLSSERLATHI